MKRKGFTLVELLVVIGIIALLVAILAPALAKIRARAYRMLCGTNLAGIGKSMRVYAYDYDGEYPRAGGTIGGGSINPTWTTSGILQAGWDSQINDQYTGGEVTVTSSFFLLIKYAEVTPKQFICSGDGARVFKLSDFSTTVEDITDVWDFGGGGNNNLMPGGYCSYSYHLPYADAYDPDNNPSRPINQISDPASPLCADRNPYFDSKAATYFDGVGAPDAGDAPYWNNNRLLDPDWTMNSQAHDRDGQNVLFNDIHVNFERQPNVGVNNDNIYKGWPSPVIPSAKDRQLGVLMTQINQPLPNGRYGPMSEDDAYLVGETRQ